LLLPEEELTKLVQVKPGEVFSRENMTETTKAISERLGNEGYAFANVNARPELDKEKRQVAFTVFIDPGRRVYVRRINVTGNTKTRDEVIRREMRQAESGWYDGEKINKSRTRVDRLGYFDEVTVETPPVPGTTDQVDMEVKVKEKPTGNIMLGAGFSSAEKFTLSGSVQQQNLFGSGKHLGFRSAPASRTRSIRFRIPIPISRSMASARASISTPARPTPARWRSAASVRIRWAAACAGAFPIAEDDYINLGLSYDRTTLKTDATARFRYQDYVARSARQAIPC
jgi:outer membrane protein insertion porin family